MRAIHLITPFFLTIWVLIGCGNDSDAPTDIPETQLAFVDHGAVVHDPVTTTVNITPDSIEYSTSQSGVIVEQWSSQLQSADYESALQIMDDYDFFQTNDITRAEGQEPCADWGGMTITIDEDDSSHSFNIMGDVCSREQWPEGVRALVNLKDEMVVKYHGIEQAHGGRVPVPNYPKTGRKGVP